MNKRDSTEQAMSRLRAWKSEDREILVIFSGVGNCATLAVKGRLTGISTELISVEGKDGSAAFAIANADFGSSGPPEFIDAVRDRLDPAAYVELCLGSGDRVLIVTSGAIPMPSASLLIQ